jgi:hypothetical protein
MSPLRTVPRAEGDRVRSGVLLAGLAALAIFAVATLLTEWAHRAWLHQAGQLQGLPAEVGRTRINGLEQLPFPLERQEAQRHAEKVSRLHSYGWTDRDRGLIHVPIEEAERALVEEGQRGAAP